MCYRTHPGLWSPLVPALLALVPVVAKTITEVKQKKKTIQQLKKPEEELKKKLTAALLCQTQALLALRGPGCSPSPWPPPLSRAPLPPGPSLGPGAAETNKAAQKM